MEVMWMMSNHDIGICHRDLEWRDIKCGHIILTAPFILIVDNVFPNILFPERPAGNRNAALGGPAPLEETFATPQ